jgi:hypothetical protein
MNVIDNVIIDIRGFPYIFEISEIYEDGAGKYIVQEIQDNGKTLKVKYLDGKFKDEERLYIAFDRAKIIHNEVIRLDRLLGIESMPFKGSNEYLAIGYLAKNGYCTAQVPPSTSDKFEKTYQQLTNDDAKKYLNSNYEIVKKEESKWHLELRIHFSELNKNISCQIAIKDFKVKRSLSGLTINNNPFIWNLFKIGFRLGHQNVDFIKTHIPKMHISDFNLGYSIIKEKKS